MLIALLVLLTSLGLISTSYYLGKQQKRVEDTLESIITALKKVKPEDTVEDTKAVIVDPMDIAQQVKYEHDQMMEKLNGK